MDEPLACRYGATPKGLTPALVYDEDALRRFAPASNLLQHDPLPVGRRGTLRPSVAFSRPRAQVPDPLRGGIVGFGGDRSSERSMYGTLGTNTVSMAAIQPNLNKG